jgi:hypothetical protein
MKCPYSSEKKEQSSKELEENRYSTTSLVNDVQSKAVEQSSTYWKGYLRWTNPWRVCSDWNSEALLLRT